ncbi:MAG: hypothetical protein AAGI44_13770 [Pseudomonadota bacterium]
MKSFVLLFLVALITSGMTQPLADSDGLKSTVELERDARIKSALARERGEITAIEADNQGEGGVFVGFSSGAVAHCPAKEACRLLEGTPEDAVSGAVQEMVVSSTGNKNVLWVIYPFGSLYHCVDGSCQAKDLPAETTP